MVVWQQQHIIRAIYVYPFSYRFTFVVRLLFAKFRFKYTPQPTMEQPQDIVVPFHHQPTIQDYIMLLGELLDTWFALKQTLVDRKKAKEEAMYQAKKMMHLEECQQANDEVYRLKTILTTRVHVPTQSSTPVPVESLDSFSDSFERKFLDMAK